MLGVSNFASTGMSWATYGTWVYRVELARGADKSVKSVCGYLFRCLVQAL